MVCQPNSATSGLLGDIKAAICNDSNSTILELLQLVGVCRSSTTPERNNSIESGAQQYLCKEFQTCQRQKGCSMSSKADRPGDVCRNCLNLFFPI